MAVNFSKIQPHLQQSVLRKLNFNDFSHFSACSHGSNLISKAFKFRLPWNAVDIEIIQNDVRVLDESCESRSISSILDEFPVRIVAHSICIRDNSDESCRNAIKLCENFKISVVGIIFQCEIFPIPLELFNQLLKISKVEEFYTGWTVPLEYIYQSELKNISNFCLSTADPFPIEALLTLKATDIRLWVNFTPREFNLFLKQWSNGDRKINCVNFSYEEGTIVEEEYESVFEGIPYELIWSKEFHSQSIVSYKKIEDLERWRTGYKSYSLKKEEERLLVIVYKRFLCIQLVFDPFSAFVDWL